MMHGKLKPSFGGGMATAAATKRGVRISLGNLILASTAKFYKCSQQNVSNAKFEKILKAAGQGKDGNFLEKVIRKTKIVDGITFQLSYEVHRLIEEPPFLTGTKIKEIIYGYCLLVEVDNYLIVSKRNTASIDGALEPEFEPIPYESLACLFNEDEVAIEKIALNFMTVSKLIVRKRTFEGENISLSVPRVGIGRQMPGSVKVNHFPSEKSITVSLNTGRISEGSVKGVVDVFLRWCQHSIGLLNSVSSGKDYLSGYARPINFSAASDQLKPIGILFAMDWFNDGLATGSISNICYYRNNGMKAVSEKLLKRGMEFFKNTFSVETVSGDLIEISHKNNKIGRLKSGANHYIVELKLLKNIRFMLMNKEEKLLNFIKKHGYFSLVFNDPNYFGIFNHVFMDNGVVSEVARFLRNIRAIDDLDGALSEKGDHDIGDTVFSDRCIFGVMEKTSDLENLVCDDMGDEWADFIEFGTSKEGSKIRLIHCKHGDEGLGASPFHDVVSQALKNLSHLFAGRDEIQKKEHSWRGVVAGTGIQNIRKEGRGGLLNEFSDVLADHNVTREVVLAVTFVRKSSLSALVSGINAGTPPKAHELQLIWLISTFILGAQQMGVHPYIYCKP
jgi:hypothetical protein